MDSSDVSAYLRYKFKNNLLLREALTHKSWLNENKEDIKECAKQLEDFQRLEFLGDSVLKLIQSTKLYTSHSDWSEGQMTKTRSSRENNDNLKRWAIELGIDKFIRCGNGVDKQLLCAQVFESVLGAIWVDCGYDFKMISDLYESWNLSIIEEDVNYKGKLQEIAQKQKLEVKYENIQDGRTWISTCFLVLDDQQLENTGTAQSKKKAEQIAAKKLLDFLGY